MGTIFVVVSVVGVVLALLTRIGDPRHWKKKVGILGGICALISIVGGYCSRARSDAEKNAKIAALEKRTERRTISPWSRERLLAMLRASPGTIKISSTIMGGDEPRDYALQLFDLFQEAGWKTEWCVVGYGSPPPLEITCNVDEEKNAILAKAFTVAHITFFYPMIVGPQRDQCDIRVGSRIPEMEKWVEEHRKLGTD